MDWKRLQAEPVAGGPEDCHAAGYDAAYSACYRAVKAKYPDVTPIAVTDQPFSRHGPSAPVDLYGEHQRMSTTGIRTDLQLSLRCAVTPIVLRCVSDLHIYTGPTAGPPWGYFVDPKNWAMLEGLPRNGSKVFVSEYAAGVSQGDGDDPTFNCYDKFPGGPHLSQGGLGNVQAAVHEAAWMAAMERNGDVVKMAAYAPLLMNALDGVQHNADGSVAACPYVWSPILIGFNRSTIVRTPSYWVQQLFSTNRGGVALDTEVSGPGADTIAASATVAASGETVLKLVNFGNATAVSVAVHAPASGAGSCGWTSLSGPALAENSWETPDAIKPVTHQPLPVVNRKVDVLVLPNSVNVLRLPASSASASAASAMKSDDDAKMPPVIVHVLVDE